MAYQDKDIIYVLTKEDVQNVARELKLPRVSGTQHRAVKRFIERFYGEGDHGWHAAITEALSDLRR